MDQKKKLKSLSGIKSLSTVGIFLWHAFPQVGLPDLGARLCEIFIVSSGFLVAYNRHGRFSMDLRDSFSYVRGKVFRFYPSYFIGFAFYVPLKLMGGVVDCQHVQRSLVSIHASIVDAGERGI